MEMTVAVEIAAPHIKVVSEPEPKGAENQEPENQPEPLPDSIFKARPLLSRNDYRIVFSSENSKLLLLLPMDATRR